MTKDTNFKFGKHAPRESRVMTPENFFEKGAWQGSRDSVNFWVLNAGLLTILAKSIADNDTDTIHYVCVCACA